MNVFNALVSAGCDEECLATGEAACAAWVEHQFRHLQRASCRCCRRRAGATRWAELRLMRRTCAESRPCSRRIDAMTFQLQRSECLHGGVGCRSCSTAATRTLTTWAGSMSSGRAEELGGLRANAPPRTPGVLRVPKRDGVFASPAVQCRQKHCRCSGESRTSFLRKTQQYNEVLDSRRQ